MTVITPEGGRQGAAAALERPAAWPLAVRLRGTPVKLAFALAVLVLAGSFVWAFVAEPRLKAIQADAHAATPPPASGRRLASSATSRASPTAPPSPPAWPGSAGASGWSTPSARSPDPRRR